VVLAAYALHSVHVYSLPIADIVSALTVALPPLAGVALETVFSFNTSLAAKGHLQTSRIFQIVVGFFLVYETMLATLAGEQAKTFHFLPRPPPNLCSAPPQDNIC